MRMKEEFDTMSDISFFERPKIDILTLEDMQSAFYLFFLSTLLSTIVAIIECLVPKTNKRMQNIGKLMREEPHGQLDMRQK